MDKNVIGYDFLSLRVRFALSRSARIVGHIMSLFWILGVLIGITTANAQTFGEFEVLEFIGCEVELADISYPGAELCWDRSGKIRVEAQIPNRAVVGKLGDLTPVLNNFARKSDTPPKFDILITASDIDPNIRKVVFFDDAGDLVDTTFSFFVWSRNMYTGRHRANDYALAFNPTRSIKCYNTEFEPTKFEGCITYYTATACDSWHGRFVGQNPSVSFPTLAFRTYSYQDSVFMLENFSDVQVQAEILLNETLHLTCEN